MMNRAARILLLLGFLGNVPFAAVPLAAQQPASPPPSADIVEILADRQEKAGDTFYFQGNVEIRYRGMTLTADDVTYNDKTRVAEARGNVVYEGEDDRLEASEALYHLDTGEGTFLDVEGTVGSPPRPSRDYLLTTNPTYFKAERVERRGDGSYMAYRGWVTNCQPGRPKWRLKAARVLIKPDDVVHLHRATFLLGPVPAMFTPFAAVSIADEPRQSGFLFPSFGNDTRRGASAGSGYFWAINPHADLTVEGEYFNQGGWTHSALFRARPSVSSNVEFTYFGATAGKLARTLRRRRNIGVNQSGQFFHLFAVSDFPHGFRGVVDFEHLSSFRFRLGFAETFSEAIRSDVRGIAFLSNNPDSLYFNAYFRRDESFLERRGETSVTIFALPGIEFGSRPRLLRWLEEQPIYFSYDARVGGVRRDEPRFSTPELVQRFELHSRLQVPLRLGQYFALTPSVGLRAAHYGSRLLDDPSQPEGKRVAADSLQRLTEEVEVDLRFPSFARVYEHSGNGYKHVVEPTATYRYVNGVRSFNEILRFDEMDILTDTHEVEYGIVQRLYVRGGAGPQPAREILSWRLTQKYFFDPDFGEALREGQRNVFETLTALSPFAFADKARRFSPIISSLRISPRGRYDADLRLDYDPDRGQVLNVRASVRAALTSLTRVSLTHIAVRPRDEILQPRANQLQLRFVRGQLYRTGFNVAFATTWDVRRQVLPATETQVSYNWDCCGVGISFRRLGIGALRSQNEYRFTFTVANVGSFGTISRRRRLF